jgi:hypothetical protein
MESDWPETEAELEQLRQWKESALILFNSYDAQKLAKLLGMPLGVDIMPNLQPAIEKVLARVADLESKARKLDKELAYEHGRHHLTHERAKSAELALRKIKEAYEARSELFTSDAECAQNMADWATLALKECEKP